MQLDKKTTIRLPIPLHKKVMIAAFENEMSMSKKIVELIEKGLKIK